MLTNYQTGFGCKLTNGWYARSDRQTDRQTDKQTNNSTVSVAVAVRWAKNK